MFFTSALSFSSGSLLGAIHAKYLRRSSDFQPAGFDRAASAAEGKLAPGKPAGVQKAQLLTTPLIIVGVVAAVAAGVAISQSKSSQAVITQTAGTP